VLRTLAGGTELSAHSNTSSEDSHHNGYKLDYGINSNPCLDSWMPPNNPLGEFGDGLIFTSIPDRVDQHKDRPPDVWKQWKDDAGNTYCLEGDHWDVTFARPPECTNGYCKRYGKCG
jgi:hypothetical protein